MLSKGVMSKAERDAFRSGQRQILGELRTILAQGNGGAATWTVLGSYVRERLIELRAEEDRLGD